MFSFFEDVFSLTGLPAQVFDGGFKVINISNQAVYVENQSSILSISGEEIRIKLKKGVCIVSGHNLKIKNMTESTIVVVGKIEKLSTE